VLFAFEAVNYSVLLYSEMATRRILTNIAGVNAPVKGALQPGVGATQMGSAPALMCILGPSGAGAPGCSVRHELATLQAWRTQP
jgi:hypothetical protein